MSHHHNNPPPPRPLTPEEEKLKAQMIEFFSTGKLPPEVSSQVPVDAQPAPQHVHHHHHHHHHEHHHNDPLPPPPALTPEEEKLKAQMIEFFSTGKLPPEACSPPPIDAQAAQQHVHHHHHHHKANQFWRGVFTVFKVAAIGASAVFGGPLLVPVVAGLGGAGAAVATGAAVAVADAAMQEVGVQLGCQNKFSVNEVLETGVSGGLGSAVASAGIIPKAMTSAAGAAVTQAAEIHMGSREDLDPKAVAMQGASSVVSSVVSQAMPAANDAIQQNFPDAVKKVGEENIALATTGVVNATANSAVQSIALNTPTNLEGILINALGSTLGAKVGAAVNDALYNLNRPDLNESDLSESELTDTATEDNAPIGEMCGIDETANVQLPTNQEMQEFLEMVKQTIERMTLAPTNTASNETGTIKPTNLDAQLNDSEVLASDVSSDDVEVIPPVIVIGTEPPLNEESFYDSLSDWQKAGLSIGIVLGAVALLPEEIGAALLFGLGRLGTALIPGVGPLTEALAVDSVAGEAIAGTASGAAAINFVGKLLSKTGMFSQKVKSADVMMSEQAVKSEITVTEAAENARRIAIIQKNIQNIEEFLGEGMNVTKPSLPGKSDLILTSADGTKKIRFDIQNSHGQEPHVNVEIFEPRNAFPGDEKMIKVENHHVYPINNLQNEEQRRLSM